MVQLPPSYTKAFRKMEPSESLVFSWVQLRVISHSKHVHSESAGAEAVGGGINF